MRTMLAVLVAGLGLVFTVPMSAHHSIAGEYDSAMPVTLTGTVTKLEWMNPHARLYIDVTGPDGTVSNWNVELGSRSSLTREGWTSKTLPTGATVTVKGNQARNGSKRINGRDFAVQLPDGRKILSNIPQN